MKPAYICLHRDELVAVCRLLKVAEDHFESAIDSARIPGTKKLDKFDRQNLSAELRCLPLSKRLRRKFEAALAANSKGGDAHG